MGRMKLSEMMEPQAIPIHDGGMTTKPEMVRLWLVGVVELEEENERLHREVDRLKESMKTMTQIARDRGASEREAVGASPYTLPRRNS